MLAIFAVLLGLVAAVPLTVVIPANDRMCFYAQANELNSKVALSFVVMAGGSFDIDATIKRPDKSVIEQVTKSTGDEFVFTAQTLGEYELCFYNEMSTFADKKVEFEFDIDTSALRASLPETPKDADTSSIERYINSMEVRTAELARSLQYYKARNARNQSTVASTHDRVWWFSTVELLLVVVMAFLNVTVVQLFFKGSRKNLV